MTDQHTIASSEIFCSEAKPSVRCTVECACGHQSQAEKNGVDYLAVMDAEIEAKGLHISHAKEKEDARSTLVDIFRAVFGPPDPEEIVDCTCPDYRAEGGCSDLIRLGDCHRAKYEQTRRKDMA